MLTGQRTRVRQKRTLNYECANLTAVGSRRAAQPTDIEIENRA